MNVDPSVETLDPTKGNSWSRGGQLEAAGFTRSNSSDIGSILNFRYALFIMFHPSCEESGKPFLARCLQCAEQNQRIPSIYTNAADIESV